MQFTCQTSTADPLLDDEAIPISENKSCPFSQNKDTGPQPQEEDPQEDSDTAFNYDLLLPPPNPLPKKTPSAREPLQFLFEYPIQKLPKFIGKEQIDPPSSHDTQEAYKNNAKIYSERIKEARVGFDDNSEENREVKRLCDHFAEEEKIVYRRRPKNDDEGFNTSFCNLKTQSRRIMDETEVGSETLDNGQGEQKDKALRFESRFESGNLSMVSMVSENEYNCLLQSDINTYGFGQWFFFAVRGGKRNQTVKFNILNYRKSNSLHNLGMRVMVYSMKEAKKNNIGWTRGAKAEYFCNSIPRENLKRVNYFRTLSFEYTFKNNSDCVFFAYSQPYTYTDLLDYFDTVETDEIKSRYFGRSTLCKTLAGNKCELVTITQKTKGNECDKKKCIFLTARVHPGETNSSFLIQGVMEFLLSSSKEAEALREKFIFKIIPMLNPDGVIHGNSRCSLAGCDLNRKWRKPSPKLHPTIYNAKILVSELNRKYGVTLFCDFHGHSKKRDMFLYGCQEGTMPLEIREFAFILEKLSPLFSYRKCSFFMESYKLGAARITLYQELKIKYAYTLETSFFGPERTGKHYSSEELLEFGGKFCKAVLLQFSKESGIVPKKQATRDMDQELADIKRKMIEEFYSNQDNLMNADPDSGSESEVSEDEAPRNLLRDLLPKAKKRAQPTPKKPTKPAPRNTKPSVTPTMSMTISDSKKIPADRISPMRDRLFRVAELKKSPDKLEKPAPRDQATPMPDPEKTPEPLENFCFVVRRLEGKYEAKTDIRRQMINTFQEGFNEVRAAFESLIIQDRRADREREDRLGRLVKERKYLNGMVDIKRLGNLSVTNGLRNIPPSVLEKGGVSSATLKQTKSFKEIKSGRDIKIFDDNIVEVEYNEDTINGQDNTFEAPELKESKSIGPIGGIREYKESSESRTLKEIRDVRDLRDFRESREGREVREGRETRETREGRDTQETQTRQKTKKPRAPFTLEPLGKATISGSFEKVEDKGGFKLKKKINHPGFQKRSEEDGSVIKEPLKEAGKEGPPRVSINVNKESSAAIGFRYQNLVGLDRWKKTVMMAEEMHRDNMKIFTGMASPKKQNVLDREILSEDLQASIELGTQNRRNKKDNVDRGNCLSEEKPLKILKKPVLNNSTARNGDLRLQYSSTTTPAKSDLFRLLKSLNSTSGKNLFKS